MIEERVIPLLDHAAWQGKIFSNGWRSSPKDAGHWMESSTGPKCAYRASSASDTALSRPANSASRPGAGYEKAYNCTLTASV